MDRKIDLFNSFESKYNLWGRKINDIEYWHIIRIAIYEFFNNNLKGQKIVFNSFQLKVNKNINLQSVFSLFKSFVHLKRISQKDVMVVTGGGRVKFSNYYYNPKIDFFIDSIQKDYIVFEQLFHHKNFLPVPTKNLVHLNYFQFMKRIHRFFLFFNYFLRRDARIESKLLSNYIFNELNFQLSEKIIFKLILRGISDFKYSRVFYTYAIKKINPKIVLLTVSYSTHKMALIDVCKAKNIPTVELQHGVMGRYHVAYNFHEFKGTTFPDYLFIYGDYWFDHTRLPISKGRVISTGSPFHEQRVKQIKRKFESKNNTILFISNLDTGDELSRVAIKLQKIFPDHKILYKLHPEEYLTWKAKYPHLVQSHIQVIDNNDNDIHFYLGQVSTMIGVSSTVIFEALSYDLKIIIYNLKGSNYVEYLIELGRVLLANNISEIVKNIKLQHNAITNLSYFWERDSNNKLVSAINNIIDNSNN